MLPTKLWLAAASVFLAVLQPTQANVVTPGQTVSPDVFTLNSEPPLLGVTSGVFSIGAGVTGSWQQVVAVDPFGVTCAGCLDFAFQLSNDPTSLYPIFAVNVSQYFGVATDVGYLEGEGDTFPVSVARGPGGGGIGFSFATSAAVISPGYVSPWLIVATNATAFNSAGFANIAAFTGQTNITTQISGLFEPSFEGVPEPSAAALISLGFVGIFMFRFRHAQKL
jgi:hypothetical protein